MVELEHFFIELLLNIVSREDLNSFLRDPRNTAVILGGLIAVSGAILGTFLLLRGMSLTSDAISHTVLLGIVVAFLLMVTVFDMEADLSSPLLILGAAGAGVATVILTELIFRSGLVKQDAALGLAFPFLFALAIILVSRFADDVHLDEDAVMVGEIGVAWANTNSHCYENCETVVITADDARATVARQCTNCGDGISPRSDQAIFEEICANCGTYTPAQAWREGFVDIEPTLVFFPKSLTVMGVMTVLTIVFVTLFYKELKLSTFDTALAKALGFRPGMLNYLLMGMVSLVAVGAFDAVGSILVVAFFIIPPATAYLLTDRLSVMLIISPLVGGIGAILGYDLARGQFLGIFEISDLLVTLNKVFDLNLQTVWDSSISASMVMMLFVLFVFSWILSPKYGLISTFVRRRLQRRHFANQVLLGHVYNHQDTREAEAELAVSTLHEHLHWSVRDVRAVMTRLRALNLVNVTAGLVHLTERGRKQVESFRKKNLAREM